jgi:hypothetical protein
MVQHIGHFFTHLFLLIAEPRVVRIIQLCIYLSLIGAGYLVLSSPSPGIEGVLTRTLVVVFGGFLSLGGLLGAVAVLPGIWWLERTGVIAAITALLMYMVVVISLGTSTMGFLVSLALIGSLIKRWIEIRRYQLAPRE